MILSDGNGGCDQATRPARYRSIIEACGPREIPCVPRLSAGQPIPVDPVEDSQQS